MLHLLPFRMDALLIGAVLALVLRGPRADSWQRSCKRLFLLVHSRGRDFGRISLSRLPMVEYGRPLRSRSAAAGLIGATLRPSSIAFRLFIEAAKNSRQIQLWILRLPPHLGGAWSHLSLCWLRLHSSVVATAITDLLSFATTFVVAKLS